MKRLRDAALAIAGLAVLASIPSVAEAQVAGNPTLEESAAPGQNYDKAEFRLWYPSGSGPLQAVVVLVPGSNGDGRAMVDDPAWQAFAVRHKLALVACRFTDKPHDQGFIEEYVDVAHGSGQALLGALTAFAGRSKHPEIASAPLLLWGMSAGGQFNYEFTAWKPERVAAFVVNKGGIYYTALVPSAARAVPGILFTGGKDLEFRTNTIDGLFAVNRRAGALWALANEPSAAHIVGRSREVAMIFFEDVLALRVGNEAPGAGGSGALKAISEKSGFIGDLEAKTVRPIGDAPVPNLPTAWLPTPRVARVWQALVTETPFEPSGPAVTQTPEALVRAFAAAFNAHDVVRMLTMTAADIRWMTVSGDKVGIETQDATQLELAMQKYFRDIPSSRSELRTVTASGPFVSAVEQAQWESSGQARQQCSFSVYEIKDDKIKNVWYFPVHKC